MQASDITFQYIRYNNDYVWAFDVPGTAGRYHGYTRDKQTNFNVYDEETNAYTTYGTVQAFNQWLQSLKPAGYQNIIYPGSESINNIKYNGLPETNVGGFNATPLIIIAGAALITWLIYQN